MSLFLELEWSYLRDSDLRCTCIHIDWQIQSTYFLIHAFRPLEADLEYITYAYLFQNSIAIIDWNLIIKSWAVFEKIGNFVFGGILSMGLIFGARMFTLSGTRPTEEKIKSRTWTKFVQLFRHKPGAHSHTYVIQKTKFSYYGGSKCVNPSKFCDRLFSRPQYYLV